MIYQEDGNFCLLNILLEQEQSDNVLQIQCMPNKGNRIVNENGHNAFIRRDIYI